MDKLSFVQAANEQLDALSQASSAAQKQSHEGPKVSVELALQRILNVGTQISTAICSVVDTEGRDPLCATVLRTASVDIVPARVKEGKLEAYAGFIKDTKWGKVLLFPGGKLQADDESLFGAAGRELQEETELELAKRIKPIGIVDVWEDKGRLPFGYIVQVSDTEMAKMRAASDLEKATLVWMQMEMMQYVAQTEGERRGGRLGHMNHRELLLGLNDKFGADFDKYELTQPPKTFGAESVQQLRSYLEGRRAERVPVALLEQIEKAGQIAAEAIKQLKGEEGLKWKTVSDEVFKPLEKKWLRPLFDSVARAAPAESGKSKGAVWPEDKATIIGSVPCRVVVNAESGELCTGEIRLNETIADAAFRAFAEQQLVQGVELEKLETTVTVKDMIRDPKEAWVNISCTVTAEEPEQKKARTEEK